METDSKSKRFMDLTRIEKVSTDLGELARIAWRRPETSPVLLPAARELIGKLDAMAVEFFVAVEEEPEFPEVDEP